MVVSEIVNTRRAGGARVVALDGPKRAWEVSDADGHRLLDGRLHLTDRVGRRLRRRTFDPFGAEVWRREWSIPKASSCPISLSLPLGSGSVIVAQRTTEPWLRVGFPGGDWRTIELPADTHAIDALIPLRNGGALVCLLDLRGFYTLAVSPDGVLGPTTAPDGFVHGLTERIELWWGDVDIYALDDPWEPSWDVILRPAPGIHRVRRRAGQFGLEAVGHLLFDGWLYVTGADGRMRAVHVAEPRKRDGLALGPLTPLRGLFGLSLVPGARRARKHLRAHVPGPFDRWRILTGSAYSVRPFDDEPRAVRWSRLDDAGHGIWLFHGPPAPGTHPTLVIDPVSAKPPVSGWSKHLIAGSIDLYSGQATTKMGSPLRPSLPEECHAPAVSESPRRGRRRRRSRRRRRPRR